MAELLDFNFDINDDTGELDLNTKPVEKKPDEKTTVLNDPTVGDNVSSYESRFSSLESQLAKSNNMLLALGQYLTGKEVQQQQTELDNTDDAELEGLFTDVDKGKKFINNLVNKVSNQVRQELKVLDPVIANSTVQNEFVQFVQQNPDIQHYVAGMKMLHNANPNLGLQDLYSMARRLGLKQVKQDVQPNNVTNINRNLPDKTNSENANLNTRKQAMTPKEALEQAMEDMNYAVNS